MAKKDYMTIFLITVFDKCEPGKDSYSPNLGYRRSVGFRPTFELAEEVVKTNMCDIWECCYDYALRKSVASCIPCIRSGGFISITEILMVTRKSTNRSV